jgi:hypothetical protein
VGISTDELQQKYSLAAKEHYGAKNSVKWAAILLVVGLGFIIFSQQTLLLGIILIIIALLWIIFASVTLSNSGKRLDDYEKLAAANQMQLPSFDPAALTGPVVKSTRRHTGNLLAGLGALALIVGALLPWGTVTSIFGTFAKSGTEGDGVLFLILGVVVGLVALLHKGTVDRSYCWPLAVIGLISFGFSVMDLISVSGVAADSSEYVAVSIGAGLYLVVIGAGIVFASGLCRVPPNS